MTISTRVTAAPARGLRFRRCVLPLLFCLLPASILQAQPSRQAEAKPVALSSANSAQPQKETAPRWLRYCLQVGGFCFEHPASWTHLGAVYNGAGVVFAEPNKGRAQTEWNHITAAALDLPEPAEGSERPAMNDLINQVMTPPEGTAIHTVERMATVVSGYPAQVITAEVQEPGKPVATEQVAFIDADDVLYTVALRCESADYRRLKPIFLRVLKSWSELPPPPSQPDTGAAPKSDAEPAK